VAVGRDICEAVNNAEEMEETAKLHFLLAGREANCLGSGEVEELLNSGGAGGGRIEDPGI
jgi:ribulose-5-phosphate 4-epimerase/fuculose-1-phosphate aldolase